MRTLRKPLPDELLYGALASATYRYGYWSPKGFLDVLYGSRTVVAVADLPSNLQVLAQSTQEAWALSAEELARRHTLFGYYAHFRTERQRQKVLATMAANSGSLQVRLGICAGSARVPARFRLCPSCHAADLRRFREAYWHRGHHLPGVLVCHLHGDLLLETAIPFRPIGRHVYEATPLELADLALQPIVSELENHEVAQAVAAQSFELLTSQTGARCIKPDYRSQLKQFGWHSGCKGSESLEAAFRACFGDDMIAASFRDGTQLTWLQETLRAPRRPLHPFKHVLMMVFLKRQQVPMPVLQEVRRTEKTWGIFRDERLRREAASLASMGLKTHAVAQALEVDWKTAHRLLQPMPPASQRIAGDAQVDRQSWESLASANPDAGKKELRAWAPALYARLYRNDHEWLLAWQSPAARYVGHRPRVNWQLRDAIYEELVRRQAMRVLHEDPPRRVTRNGVLGALGLRALLAHRSALLPRTCAVLDELCESVDAFQVRRVAAVLSRESGSELPAWHVLREAGVQPSRFPDGGRGLLVRAAHRVERGRLCQLEGQARV